MHAPEDTAPPDIPPTADQAPGRDVIAYDVVIVGAGPAGLSAAIRLKQRAAAAGTGLSVALVEKAAEIGGHILSGVIVDPKGLAELFPDWKAQGAPLETPVHREQFLLLGRRWSVALPMPLLPPLMHNRGCHIGSLGALTRWLAAKAEALGVEIYPGMAASEPVLDRSDGSGAPRLLGVVAGVFGIRRDGTPGPDYQPGVELRGRYTLIAEGARGSLAGVLIRAFDLDRRSGGQKFGLGLKELWQVPAERHRPGFVQHTVGWPLQAFTGGGSFLYHFGDRYVAYGYVVHLNYRNPHLSPFDEFQRSKHHPAIRKHLEGGTRISYGARAITEGGLQSVPTLAFPGGALIGCSAGFVNVPRIKGSHNAMKTGMLAADAAYDAVMAGRGGDTLEGYEESVRSSWVFEDLRRVRNAKPLLSRLGTVGGGFAGVLDMWCQTLFRVSPFGTLKHGRTDAAS